MVVPLQETAINRTTTHRVSAAPADQVAAAATNIWATYEGWGQGTRRGRLRVVDGSLRASFGGGAFDFSKLQPDEVRRFLATRLEARRTASHASKLASALRSHFRYRATCGDRVGTLTAVVSSPVH